MTLPATAWPAAVSCRSSQVLDAPVRPATVLGVFPSALYLEVDGALLPVLTPAGLRLPTALVLGRGLPPSGWGVRQGEVVEVGTGRVRLPGAEVVAVRSWRPHRVVPAARRLRVPAGLVPAGLVPAGLVPAGRRTSSPAWRPAAADLTRLLLDGQDPAAAVAALVGAGPGLTPSGDDVLCGVLLGLRHTGHLDGVASLWHVVRRQLGATTTLSAALLSEAADGYAVPQVVRLASALAREDDCGAVAAADGVAAVGNSSGRDLLAGFLGALEAAGAAVPALREAS